jgi:Flp pilus assembly protein TadD
MTSAAPYRILICLALLTGPLAACQSVGALTIPLTPPGAQPEVAAFADSANPPTAVSIDPNDDLALGKRHFAETNYGLAEKHFRRAVEKSAGPTGRDAEAWIGLAASYDRLRRFDLADRAYGQVLQAIGPTPEVLNNQGYSFMLRRDYRRARAVLVRARAKDPTNATILNNLALLEQNERTPVDALSVKN